MILKHKNNKSKKTKKNPKTKKPKTQTSVMNELELQGTMKILK